MPEFHDLKIFALAALLMVLTPGPNMIYLISRSICQGRAAGVISLFGVIVGFLFHMTCAIIGLTAMFLAVPFAYTVVKLLGAAYLLWLAWGALSGASSPFDPKQLAPDSPARLFRMGLLTNVLNPKVAVFYMSLFPQFIHPERGSIITQSITLGLTQCAISFTVNFVIVMTASAVCAFFKSSPGWLRLQKWVMGLTLSGLAVRVLTVK
jgi:threonine/homoserine/homoserine lactone efflux protein